MSDTEQDNLGTRIFLGNLSFRVRDTDLQELLQPYGEVVSVKLAKRMNRFLGFAFAVFKEKASADDAVEKLNNTVFHDRDLIVEIAHPSHARKPYEHRHEEGTNSDHSGTEGDERPRGRRGRDRHRGPRRAPQDGEEGTYEEGARAERADAEQSNMRHGGGGRYRYRSRGGHVGDGQGSGDNYHYYRGGYRGGRPARSRASLPDSETLLFVSNLPFNYEDEDLARVFEGLSITSSRVVKRHRGICRGFGFVDMVDHEAQLDAIEKINNTMVDGRTLTVKIAKVRQEDAPPPRQGEEVPAEQQEQQPIENYEDAAAENIPTATEQPEANESSGAEATAVAGNAAQGDEPTAAASGDKQ